MNSTSFKTTKTHTTRILKTTALATAPMLATKRSSRLAKIGSAFARWLKGPDLTLEQWQMIERAYAPKASHHTRCGLWNRGW